MFEHEQFDKERTSKQVIERHGWLFYAQPLPIEAADLDPLRAACSDPTRFHLPCGIKMCGGFHPDYQLSWKQGDRSFDVQFCFGCGEARLFMGDTLAVEADISRRFFLDLLEHYHGQRPEHAFAR